MTTVIRNLPPDAILVKVHALRAGDQLVASGRVVLGVTQARGQRKDVLCREVDGRELVHNWSSAVRVWVVRQ